MVLPVLNPAPDIPVASTSPLRHLDIALVDAAAKAESRNREVHLPPVSVYRWWARRTMAVNGAILDAVAKDLGPSLLVADVFAGGGVIPLAAATRGHRVYAQDLNPWATYGLRAMFNLPPAGTLPAALDVVEVRMRPLLERAYATQLPDDGTDAMVSHTFRVATATCPCCKTKLLLYPHAVVSLERRKESGQTEAFLACPRGHLFQGFSDRTQPCPACETETDPNATYTRRRQVTCHACKTASNLHGLAMSGTWDWEVVLIERTVGRRRHLGLPTPAEKQQAETGWAPRRDLPAIPEGRETAVLRRHGFTHWHDLYPARQRHVLEKLLTTIEACGLETAIADAMRLAALGVGEMAGLASRWDRWYLKSYETMTAHRFNFTTFTVEPNVWGMKASGRGTFQRRIALFEKATTWMTANVKKKLIVEVVEGSSERLMIPAGKVDIVLTDPPYHDDVQYGELSLPLRAWAELSTEGLEAEAVATDGASESFEAYRALLARIFTEARRVLAGDGHLIFSYANRDPEAWVAVLGGLHQAGLQAAGYAVVHSENETDHAKRNVRACSMDLILDLIPAGKAVRQWRPVDVPTNAEGTFLRLVGDTMLNNVGVNGDGWIGEFLLTASSCEFITGRGSQEELKVDCEASLSLEAA
jgi:putative DNA methylase